MTHDKFIELLNLYVDGELTPVEATELEREIHQSPQRRRIYREYCQMHRACKLLHGQFAPEAVPATAETLAAGSAASGGGVVAFEGGGRGSTWVASKAMWGALGGVAAAACVAFLVVSRSGPAEALAGDGSALASTTQPSSVLLVEATAPELNGFHQVAAAQRLNPDSLRAWRTARPFGLQFATAGDTGALAWLESVQPSEPLLLGAERLKPQDVWTVADESIRGVGSPEAQAAAFIGFQAEY